LFNGKDLDGWQQVGPGSFWHAREKIADATIRVGFKFTAKESDSGVFIRIRTESGVLAGALGRVYLACKSGVPYYFLARSGSLGTCHEAGLLWEEGVKMPATAMSTSGFRHGPQEIVRKGMRFCLWIDQVQMCDQDLSVDHDLRELGALVMLIGENLPRDGGDLVFRVNL